MSSSITRQCQACNSEFQIDRYSVSKGAGKYCSLKCKYSVGRTVRTCQRCLKSFESKMSGNKMFCSKGCKDVSLTLICIKCETPFTVQPYRIKQGARYCSAACWRAVEVTKKQSVVSIPCVDCGDTLRTKSSGRCQTCYRRHRNRRIKQEVIDAYGGKCACCGESAFEFLTVDHKHNDGAQHRYEHFQKSGRMLFGGAMYMQIIRDNFPEMFQILCWNCNLAKSLFGECPHIKASRD